MDKLRSLEFFLATCDGGSFAAAAKACHSDPSTVSKAISRLEKDLGLTLFQRSTRQLRVTHAGLGYAKTVRKIFQDLDTCEDELKHLNDAPTGTLRINSAVCYGHLYLQPMLEKFCQQYPDINLELELDDLHVDIIENHIDLAIRTGFVKDSRLVARRLSPMDFIVCASPNYLESRGTPRYTEEFHHHHWIGFKIKETQQMQPIYLPNQQGEYVPFDLTRKHMTDDGEAMAQMCVDGLGIAQMPHFLVRKELKDGTLSPLFSSFRPAQPETGVFAIYPKREFLPAKVRVFINFLTMTLEEVEESTHHTWAETIRPLIQF